MGKILAVCTSPEKGTVKRNTGSAELIAGHGLSGDAHAGQWHRQVSLLSYQKIEDFRGKFKAGEDGTQDVKIEYGCFGENIVADGIDFRSLPVGTFLECGGAQQQQCAQLTQCSQLTQCAVLKITQIGKECRSRCAIYNVMGDCIMPREGVFARVIRGGVIRTGDEINIRREALYRVWIITASDKGFAGAREDKSGQVIGEIVSAAGYVEAGYTLLPDDQSGLENEMKRVCDNSLADLILTTGGTGFSPRDNMPEATSAVAQKFVPGIAEAMRAAGMAVTKRAMLSRAVCAIRASTLIINLPGSPKAARENLEFIIGELRHSLDILTGHDGNCAG